MKLNQGGKTTAERHGHNFYHEIGTQGGKKGGATTSKRYGLEFYQAIGRKGGAKMRELIQEGKLALEKKAQQEK